MKQLAYALALTVSCTLATSIARLRPVRSKPTPREWKRRTSPARHRVDMEEAFGSKE